ncbi:MAG: hypothetical protein R3E57_03485 [Porticoccaceae bacterium]
MSRSDMSLSCLVELYRICGKPSPSQGRFEVCCEDEPGLRTSIKALQAASPHSVDEILVDNNEVLNLNDWPDMPGKTIRLTVNLPASSDNKFYASVKDLALHAGSISKGQMPRDFYIIDIDYYVSDDETPEDIKTLSSICDLIRYLSKLAQYHDQKSVSDHHRLVFLNPDEKSLKPAIVLETEVTPDLLEFSPLDCSLLESIASASPSNDPHFLAKRAVLWSSLAEFVQRPANSDRSFFELVSGWSSFLSLYNNNLETYLSGFAFHKAKKEVAKAELDIASELSKIIGDISAKLFSIPISFAAVIALSRVDGVSEKLLIMMGVFLNCLLITGIINNQRRQLGRVSHSKNIVLGAFEGNKDHYPPDLIKAISDMTKDLVRNEEKLRTNLTWFTCLAWVPFLLALAFVVCDSEFVVASQICYLILKNII